MAPLLSPTFNGKVALNYSVDFRAAAFALSFAAAKIQATPWREFRQRGGYVARDGDWDHPRALVEPTFSMFSFAVCDSQPKEENEACAPPHQ